MSKTIIPLEALEAGLSPEQQAANRAALAEKGISAGGHITRLVADNLVTVNSVMMDTKRQAMMLAALECSVLITGETGTGKELIAKILHGDRDYGKDNTDLYGLSAGSRFFAINCAGLPTPLFESQLFGYVKNSHSMAFKDSPGIFRQAQGGTVFMDEVGELPMDQQAKLLRAIEARKVLPVGGTLEVPISVRFVFATNKDLLDMVRIGSFREDLYYRMAEITLQTIALRDRQEDIMPIAASICLKEKWSMPEEIPPIAYVRGNVRALRNWLLREHIAGRNKIDSIRQAIDYARSTQAPDIGNGDRLAAAELHKISRALGLDMDDANWPDSIIERLRDLIANQAEDK